MGMSASQARYLSLTARKSDLEFRGQQINQSRLMLSNQSANLYSSMLSMSVPTPPVETDFMKDVYSFSMGGDTTTLSNYKLSMGKDGYGYDILYSKPATTRQLAASTASGIQKSITRKAENSNASSIPIKIKTTYDNSSPKSQTPPNVSRLVSYPTNLASIDTTGNNKNLTRSSQTYTNFWAYLAASGESYLNKPKKDAVNPGGTTVVKNKITMENCPSNGYTPNSLTYNDNTYYHVSNDDLANVFGLEIDDKGTFNSLGALKEIISPGTSNKTGVSGAKVTEEQPAYQFYMDVENMKLMIMKSTDQMFKGDANNNGLTGGQKPEFSDNTEVKEYDLAKILGLTLDTSVVFNDEKNKNKKVYFANAGEGSSTQREYYTFNTNGSGQFQFAKVDISKATYKTDNNTLGTLNESQLKNFGIDANKNVDGNSDTSNKEYQYFRDSSTGDIWELCTTTSTSGTISESWKLFQANKTATINDKEAQLIDEADWPTGISHTQQNGEYDCYYVPDDTGTGGSYYLVAKNAFSYDPTDSDGGVEADSVTANSYMQYNANNTYKIEGFTACVISEDSVPSTIADAYDLNDYIVYATYNDSDTDFSNPLKYFVYPKYEEDADAIASYGFEKSYTGKNQLLEGRANILVDENGRLSKIDILGEGTYNLEYGQELDQAAYDEAYREYEYKLQKYEKEMADIDARTAMIQQQDKKLELQLKSIDTEHSAIQTELEALKKVIDANIKSSFGTFGG